MDNEDQVSIGEETRNDNDNIPDVQESEVDEMLKEEEVKEVKAYPEDNPDYIVDVEDDASKGGEKDLLTSGQQDVISEDDNSFDCREKEQQRDNDEGSVSSLGSKKIVKFSDENLVSGVAEVEDPLIAASTATTSELITAYQNSCSKLRVRPLEKLIKQLQTIVDFEEPQAYLNLKATKLGDNKACEALEEVFKRVRWISIDVENSSLDDEGAIALFEMFEYYHSTIRLCCGYNPKIRLRGWHAASRMIKKTSIEYLDIRNTTWTEQGIPLLARTIRAKSCLSTLHMENTRISGRPLFLLASALKLNETLKDLFIGDNKLVSADAVPLANMLRHNSTLALLDLRNNVIQDVGLAHLCQGLAEQPPTGGLATLVLWNNQITHLGMKHLARSLHEMKHLETLNLGCNRITNEGMHTIKNGLLKNCSLLRLGLMGTKITCQGVVPISEVIADNKRLIRLDLRENDIRVGGLLALSLSLKINESVTRIDIDKDLKKEPGHETMQKRLLADIYSYCQRNKMKARKREYELLEKQSENVDDTKEKSTILPAIPGYVTLPDHSSLDSPRFRSSDVSSTKHEFEFDAVTHKLGIEDSQVVADEEEHEMTATSEETVCDDDECKDDNVEPLKVHGPSVRLLRKGSDSFDDNDVAADENELSRSPDEFEKEMSKVIEEMSYVSNFSID